MKVLRITLISAASLLVLSCGAVVYSYNTRKPVEHAETYTQKVTELSKYKVGKPTTQELLELVNKERAKEGVKPLKLDTKLNATAQQKADDMVRYNYFGHVNPSSKLHGYQLVFKANPGRCKTASENLELVTDGEPTSYWLMYDGGWVDSEQHYKSIVNENYSTTGFGFATGKDGKFYAVEHFCEVK